MQFIFTLAALSYETLVFYLCSEIDRAVAFYFLALYNFTYLSDNGKLELTESALQTAVWDSHNLENITCNYFVDYLRNFRYYVFCSIYCL